MRNTSIFRGVKTDPRLVRTKAMIGVAVCVAIYGLPHRANAQQVVAETQTQAPPEFLQEVVVTATYRRQSLESVPFSLTAVSADRLAQTGVRDIASLTSQVPGLSEFDIGTRAAGAVFPVIRGLNASAAINPGGGDFRTFEQPPVGIYVGNSPVEGYFQLNDVNRIEVLRGPQGTLYGAGALGGAIRVIPNAPELNEFAGNIEIGGGEVAHSGRASQTATGMLNVPIGNTLAFRASGRYAYEPGWVNVYGILERPGTVMGGIPVLADPGDPVDSSGAFSSKSDWNYSNSLTTRESLLWKPGERFRAELAYTYAKVNGDGGPDIIPNFPGGPYPIDPRISLPSGGDNTFFAATNEPWSRKTQLASLDTSYDVGFATLSTTSSYFATNGETLGDATYSLASFPTFVGYYAGNPVNPRYVNPNLYTDETHMFSQEVRLVSNTGSDKLFDYVVGLFYSRRASEGAIYSANPGTPQYSVAEGCTAPYFYGSSFPNCLVTSGPGDIFYYQIDDQVFQDRSVYGELTWHFTRRGQITFGARYFSEAFTDAQVYWDYPFSTFLPAHSKSAPASKVIGKVNSSYEYARGHYVYALWDQGFRRGGANAIPTNPPSPLGETSRSLETYTPDTVNNYEIGLKGHFSNGLRYTLDMFDDYWDNPQVAGRTPIGNYAVWNASKAQSTGVELDLNTPLFLPGLTLDASAAYADARFTKNYFIAADLYGNIVGNAGQQLPGSPKTSAAATLIYERGLATGYALTLSLNDTYRSSVVISTFPLIGQTTGQEVSGMNLVNVSAVVVHRAWDAGIYVTNLTNKQAIQEPPAQPNALSNLTNDTMVNLPREIDLRVGYSFGSQQQE